MTIPGIWWVCMVKWENRFDKLDSRGAKTYVVALDGGRSSAWLEPQIVDPAVAGSNPVGHPNASVPAPALLTHLTIFNSLTSPAPVRPFFHSSWAFRRFCFTCFDCFF